MFDETAVILDISLMQNIYLQTCKLDAFEDNFMPNQRGD